MEKPNKKLESNLSELYKFLSAQKLDKNFEKQWTEFSKKFSKDINGKNMYGYAKIAIKAAHQQSEKEFIASFFMQEMPIIKLSSDEMELLKGGASPDENRYALHLMFGITAGAGAGKMIAKLGMNLSESLPGKYGKAIGYGVSALAAAYAFVTTSSTITDVLDKKYP